MIKLNKTTLIKKNKAKKTKQNTISINSAS